MSYEEEVGQNNKTSYFLRKYFVFPSAVTTVKGFTMDCVAVEYHSKTWFTASPVYLFQFRLPATTSISIYSSSTMSVQCRSIINMLCNFLCTTPLQCTCTATSSGYTSSNKSVHGIFRAFEDDMVFVRAIPSCLEQLQFDLNLRAGWWSEARF
ncbi:hypothetical protein BGX38DRAFT_875244 [Terfezia claveryi]|nr:hypothetical protein BGX38DRAFT_875244 [Terfezia claveryi]